MTYKNISEFVGSGKVEGISKFNIGNKDLFICNDMEFRKISNRVLRERIVLTKEIDKQKLDNIISEMLSDYGFRDFMCVNIQNALERIDDHPQFPLFFEKQTRGLKNIYLIKKIFGFVLTGSKGKYPPLEDEEEKIIFSGLLNEFFSEFLEHLKNKKIDFEDDIKKPYLKLISLLKIDEKFLINNDGQIILNLELDYKDQEGDIQKISDQDRRFFDCWQWKVIYEKYISELIRKNYGELSIKTNPIVLINPLLDESKTKLQDVYIEFDVVIHDKKKDKIIIVECKNGRNLNQNDLTDFLGKIRLLEETYEIKVDNLILVSTGERCELYRGIEKEFSTDCIKIFCIDEHRNNHKKLIYLFK